MGLPPLVTIHLATTDFTMKIVTYFLPLLGAALMVLAIALMFPGLQATPHGVVGGTALIGLAMGSMVKVDLPFVYFDQNKKCYRPGRGVSMPVEDARACGLLPKDNEEAAPEPALSEEPAVDEDGFPPDFPGHSALKEAGFTMDDVKQATREDLLAINGIGEKTADAILAAIA